MALDFKVVITVRQRFRDNDIEDTGLETEAPFVGAQNLDDFIIDNLVVLFKTRPGLNTGAQPAGNLTIS